MIARSILHSVLSVVFEFDAKSLLADSCSSKNKRNDTFQNEETIHGFLWVSLFMESFLSMDIKKISFIPECNFSYRIHSNDF